jgi:choice-of-anchor B domain-containing protein
VAGKARRGADEKEDYMKVWPVSTWAVSAALAAGLTVNAEARPPQPAGEREAKSVEERRRAHLARRSTPDPDAVPQLQPLGSTPCVGGMAGPYPCKDVDLMSFLPLGMIGGGGGSSLWGWTDPDTQREYAIMGRTNGTAFVDITDAANAVYLGNLPTHTGNSTWREMKAYGYHAYIISDGNGDHGMQIFDLRRLRDVLSPPVQFTEDGWYGGFENCHDMVVNTETGFGYCVGSNTCSGGLHMMNLAANPVQPPFVGCFASDGYTHDAQCVIYDGPDAAHVGKEICFASNEDSLTIVDVTNKSAPVMLSRTEYAGSGYTHQGWLTDDHTYFLMDDELDEEFFGHPTWTLIWNLTNLDLPVLMGHYTGPTNAIDHNQYVHQGYVYQANYQAGLRILDISQVAGANLTEAAYFDIYPSGNNSSFNGAWNNYPFFASGNVIVSGMEQGLFVLRPKLNVDFTLTTNDPVLAVCLPGADSTTLTLGAVNGYAGTVDLSAIGVPMGAVASFNPNPAAVPGSSELTVTATAAPLGAHLFTASATDGVLTHQTELTLHVADAAAGEPGPTTPPNGAFNQLVQPVFLWDAAAQGATYDIEIATDPGFTAVVSQASDLAETTFTPPAPLKPNTTHYWRVRAVNGCGIGPFGPVFSFTTTAAAGACPLGTLATPLATEGFEAGAPGWTSSGSGNTWAPSGAQVHSGLLSFHATAPGFVTDQRLVSPPVTLPTGQMPLSMQFWNYQDIESQSADQLIGCWDGAIAEISTDGGGSWTQLPSVVMLTDPYDGQVDLTAGNPLAGLDAWCGQPQPWLNSVVDVGAYAGQTVHFRFRLGTDAGVGTEGWYVDDYLVQSCVAQVPNLTVDDPTAEEKHEEGLDHPSSAVFTVTLSHPAQVDVTANYQTADGTAVGGIDYVPNSGILTIPSGSVTGTVSATIIDDFLDEDDETFVMNLSNVAGANMVDGQGQATILDDEPLPALAVGDAAPAEGNSGTAPAALTLNLVPVSGRDVAVDWSHVAGTATPGVDYLACAGTAVLPAGSTSASLVCEVVGDLDDEPNESFTVDLSNPVNATLADPQAVVSITDDDPAADLNAGRELGHAFNEVFDLAAQAGPESDQDWFRIGQDAYASYEVTVDEAGGDTRPLQLQRLAADGITVLQSAPDAGPGEARSLRFENATANGVTDERIRVASGGCGLGCGADDTYRLRTFETTARIARFNNSGSQVTVLLVQNPGAAAVAGHVWFWGLDGTLAASQPFSLAAHAQLTLDTSMVVQDGGGSMTVTHDGPYAGLTGKAVALEPETGFSFDTPMTYRPK